MKKGILFLSILAISCGKPVADFLIQGEKFVAPTEVAFENQSEKAENYEWDFGDGNSSTNPSPIHQYETSGNYIVTLKAVKGEKESTMEKRVVVDPPEDCLVKLETRFGHMLIKLYDSTPLHRDNFTKLIENGFYDGLLFHRVISGFMIQGGDPNSKDARPGMRLGNGGPGYQIPAEISPQNIHKKGALSAARMGDQVNPEKKSSGSQFYIVQGQPLSGDNLNEMENRKGIKYSEEQRKIYENLGGTPFLDMEYTVFGEVVEGFDIIDSIASVQTLPGDRPSEDVKMDILLIK